MPLDYDKLINWDFAPVERTYTSRDAILYALGLGLGMDHLDAGQRRFVFEESPEFQVVPTMAVILGGHGFWARNPEMGLDWRQIVHAENRTTLHRPLPPEATVVGHTVIEEIQDKGADKGALIYTKRTIKIKDSGEPLATLRTATYARADGGFGGERGSQTNPHAIPNRPPDYQCVLPTAHNSALLYRLSGDTNPLHVDPAVANVAGFKEPLLHGLCTMGIACHALLRTLCNYDASRIKSIGVRFSSPVYPGEHISTQIWKDGNQVSFTSMVTERKAMVLNNGFMEMA